MMQTINADGVALAPVTIGTQTLPAGSTPAQRFAATLKENVQAPQFQYGDSTVPSAPDTIGGKTAPPSPAALEKQNTVALTPEAKIADFDSQMVKEGKQLAPTAKPALPPGEIDQAAHEKLLSIWSAMTPAEREAKRETYNRDLQSIYQGRRLGESINDFNARKAQAPAATAQPTPKAISDAINATAKVSSKDGYAPASAIAKELLHGYSIPQDREYHVAELVSGLQLARTGNLTQAQVDAIIAKG